MTAAICVFACSILSFRLFYDVISTEVRALTRTQRRNPTAVGEPPPASGLARVRKRHFVSTRLPRRYAPRNDSGDMCVRLFYTVIPLVLRCYFDRSEGFNPNAAEKSPAVKVFRPYTTLPVPHRVTYDNVYDFPVPHRVTDDNVYDFTVLIFPFPQKKETVG